MRALTALVTLAACSCLQTHAHSPAERLSRVLLTTLGVSEGSPAHKLFDCSRSLGTAKCLSALSVWRAEKALEILDAGRAAQFDLRDDVEQFPWQTYSNSTDDYLYSKLAEDTERLLRYRALALSVPGYSIELESKGNGTLNFDVLRNDNPSTQRGMKKYLKDFYNIVPFMMMPGLLMSAILPFILPALKMMTVFAGMMNNMALSGAVFTLLRNNAFTNDHYEKKVIYVNEGYKNEKFSPLLFKQNSHNFDHIDIDFASGSNLHPVVVPAPGKNEFPGDNFNAVQDEALQGDWINQYYGGGDGGAFGDQMFNVGTMQSIQASPFVATGTPLNVVSAGPTQPPNKVRRSSKVKIS